MSARAWLLASRPATLTAAVVPVFVGTAVAHRSGGEALGPALAAMMGAIAIQIGTNFANDVFDFEKGADGTDRLGPTRAVQAGLLSAAAMRRGMWLAFLVATLFGGYLAFEAGPVVVAIGVLSIISGILYTAGPAPLAYVGLGDVFVMIFFGFVAVCGTVFVQIGDVPPLAWWASVPVGAICTAIIVVNNVRDRGEDVRVNKRTLAVRFGRGFGVAEYMLLMVAAYTVTVALGVYLPLLTLPMAGWLTLSLVRKEGKALNPVLANTGRLLLLFGLLFTVGLWSG